MQCDSRLFVAKATTARGRTLSTIIATVLLCVSATSGLAQEDMSFSPANFTDKKKSLQNRVRFPRVKGDVSIFIRCNITVDKRGRLDENWCYSAELGSAPFVAAIDRAIPGARIRPGRVNGKGVKVSFRYSMHFERKGDVQTITAAGNHGQNEHYTNGEFIAAQPYDRPGWTHRQCSGKMSHFLRSDVLASGSVGKSIAGDVESREECVEATINHVDRTAFIPAHFNGEPVDSTYYSVYYVYRDSRKVAGRARSDAIFMPMHPVEQVGQ